MKGRIYISGVFTTVAFSKCKPKGQIDNDPHFWTQPPTWGICRPDIRDSLEKDDYVFFVLPKKSLLPQMVYAYMKIGEIITHAAAYHRPELRSKRMGNKKVNGNIIVDEQGRYNRYDLGAHRRNFDWIIERYAIADTDACEMFDEEKIKRLAPDFLKTLNRIFGIQKTNVRDAVARWGRKLSPKQIAELLDWLNQ